ncbi:MAG: ATP-binding protein, partial [Candidatus Zixiibacteriota bacterium]
MFNRPVKEINASYPADFNQLDNIKGIVRENCLSADLPGRDVHALQLVVEEVASNIIRHAYKFHKGQIRLRLVIYKNTIVLSLIDTGRSFQPNFTGTVSLERLIETGRKGGLGFYMVQKIMDSVEYISTGGYNEMRMMKRLKPAALTGSLGRMVPLRAKFSLATFGILAVIIGVSYYFINHQTTQRLLTNLDDKITALGATIADQSAGYMLNRRSDVEFDELIVSYLRANPELRLLVITDSNRLVMAHSEDIKKIRKPFKLPENLSEVTVESETSIVSHTPDLNYKKVQINSGQQVIGNVHLTYTTSYLQEQLSQAQIATVRLTLVLFLFGLLGVYLLSNYFVEPIAKITRRVRRFTSGDLESELPLEGADEFFEISKAFNQMTTRLNEERKSVVERE